jgi:predicted  nucleic acid-binding Zn-ribbon protein
MPNRISLDKAEFEAFLTENRAFVERSEKLLQKIDNLEKSNGKLEEELKRTKEKLNSYEVNTRQTDNALRESRETIRRVLKETENRIAH